MSAEATSDLSRERLHQAIRQIFGFKEDGTADHNKFIAANPHLTPDQIAGLFAPPQNASDKIQWPEVPVFSPFAHTKAGYSQVRYAGAKYHCSRLTYAEHVESRPNLQQTDISHIMYLGLEKTSANINPRHLVAESNSLNQSRKACHIFFEQCLTLMAEGGDTHTMASAGHYSGIPETVDEFAERVRHENIVCCQIHREKICGFFWPLWFDDHKQRSN